MSVQASDALVVKATDFYTHLYLDGDPGSTYLAHQQYTVDRTNSSMLVHVHTHGEPCRGEKHYVMAPGVEMHDAILN